MSNSLTTNRDRLLTLFDGIFLGRTLHDLEKEAGASIEEVLKAVRDDEEAWLDFKANREWGTYVQESDLTTRLRDNADEPEGSHKTNALKLYADHLHWVMERANPSVYSGKIDLTAVVPIKITTLLDMGGVKKIDNVYDISASIPFEQEVRQITDSEHELLATSAIEAPSSSPFDAAVRTVVESESTEEAARKLEAMLNAGRLEDEAESKEPAHRKASNASKALEKGPSRPKSRRKRPVVRQKQALVEQGKKGTRQ